MKKISIVIPCYNEEANIKEIADEIKHIFTDKLKKYDYEILFIDNDSKDDTRKHIRQLCKENKKIK